MSQPATSTKRKRRRHVSPPVAAPAARIAPPAKTESDRTTMAGNSRIQVPADDDQKALLKRAADAAGYGNARATGGLGAYIAARALAQASAELNGEAPLVLSARVAASVKQMAEIEGCTPDETVARSLDLLRAVRTSSSAGL